MSTNPTAYQKALLIKKLITAGLVKVVVRRKKGVTVTAQAGKNIGTSIDVKGATEHLALSKAIELLDAANFIDWHNCNLK